MNIGRRHIKAFKEYADCRFWDDYAESTSVIRKLYGLLHSTSHPFIDDHGKYWGNCEPLKLKKKRN